MRTMVSVFLLFAFACGDDTTADSGLPDDTGSPPNDATADSSSDALAADAGLAPV